jgi:hypothetical protein
MSTANGSGGTSSNVARLLVVLALIFSALCAHASAARAQPAGDPLEDQPAEDAVQGQIDAGKFRFNDHFTTPFGPAYADIWLKQENFLACKPPVGRQFSFALCFFSGPAVGTPVPTDGSEPVNPPLPCTLSADGKSANCTCYAISTEQYSPYVPYFVDINAILNLDLYLRTISVCGHGGENCSPREPIREHTLWNKAPVCRAVNNNTVIPAAELISVFSPVKNADHDTGTTSNQTSCPAGKYAGCMTAPCYHTGKRDSAGHELVECKCPVYDGRFEISQAGVPCDANELTPPSADSSVTGRRPTYVWSAAHNPEFNHGPIDPPPTGCLPDAPGHKGCPLYSPASQYPVSKGSPLCREVCEAYRNGIRQSTSVSLMRGIQVGYTCDATLCTTLGIGQSTPPPPNPLRKADLLRNACSGLAEQSGLRAILALEQIDQCSCCASQVCGCAKPGLDINAETQAEITELNTQQEELEITPQCELNGTLCGAQTRERRKGR